MRQFNCERKMHSGNSTLRLVKLHFVERIEQHNENSVAKINVKSQLVRINMKLIASAIF